MATRLRSSKSEIEKVQRFINGLNQELQDDIYPLRITTLHEAESTSQKAKAKFKKAPCSIVKAEAYISTNVTPTNTSLEPLVCWNYKESGHFHAKCPKPNIVLVVKNGDKNHLSLKTPYQK